MNSTPFTRIDRCFIRTGVDSFDERSDDKGPEPEGLAMAEIDGRSEHCLPGDTFSC